MTKCPDIQLWLFACSKWADKKEKRRGSSKCTVICKSETEVGDGNIKLYIRGGEIRKATSKSEEGLTRRGLPKAKWTKKPSLWNSKTINSETRGLLLKWYIGKFPVPRRSARIPRMPTSELELFLKKEGPWTKEKEAKSTRS